MNIVFRLSYASKSVMILRKTSKLATNYNAKATAYPEVYGNNVYRSFVHKERSSELFSSECDTQGKLYIIFKQYNIVFVDNVQEGNSLPIVIQLLDYCRKR